MDTLLNEAALQKLAQVWQDRAKTVGYTAGSKAYIKAELEFFMGAAVLNDHTTGSYETNESKVPPTIVFCAIRGQSISAVILGQAKL